MTTGYKIAAAVDRARRLLHEQRHWVETHGGDLAGYVTRYGDSNGPVDERYGDGGQAIYKADHDELLARQSALAHLVGRRDRKR